MAASPRFDPWSPPRPFPALTWLTERFSFRLPAAQPLTCPPTPTTAQRRELELQVLVSALPRRAQTLLLPTLRLEAGRRSPWSQERCAAGPSMMAAGRIPQPTLAAGNLAWLRSITVAEVELGLTTIQTPLNRLSRPVRNHWLAMRAARLGQLAETLGHHPQAEPLEQEAQRTLNALRR